MTLPMDKLSFSKIKELHLIVFDLDYTLWPFYVEFATLPFVKISNGVRDKNGNIFKSFPDSTSILSKLSSLGYEIGVASRSIANEEANKLIDLFGWKRYISYYEIYPGSKVTHFQAIKKKSSIEFNHMLFFDDERKNIYDVSNLGVISILVENVMNWDLIHKGFDEFKSKSSFS